MFAQPHDPGPSWTHPNPLGFGTPPFGSAAGLCCPAGSKTLQSYCELGHEDEDSFSKVQLSFCTGDRSEAVVFADRTTFLHTVLRQEVTFSSLGRGDASVEDVEMNVNCVCDILLVLKQLTHRDVLVGVLLATPGTCLSRVDVDVDVATC